MSNVPEDLKYTKNHEWARIEGNRVTVGITDHAQGELTDIVYIELPEVGKEVQAGDELATVESVKSTSDIYSPVSGKVVEVNSDLENSTGDINADAYGKGWLVKIETGGDAPGLLSPEEYRALLG